MKHLTPANLTLIVYSCSVASRQSLTIPSGILLSKVVISCFLNKLKNSEVSLFLCLVNPQKNCYFANRELTNKKTTIHE